MANIFIDGDIDKDVLDNYHHMEDPVYVAIEITKCSICEGSGYEEWNGSLATIEAAAVTCGWCDGTGFALNLDTAIPCEVKVSVSIKNNF